jgi:chemotaxis regulatin CheY-phosphate phosphatase CheZ
MDQSEIDALMKPGKGSSSKKSKSSAPAAEPEAPAAMESPAEAPPAPTAQAEASPDSQPNPQPDQQARLITEIGSVTAVTERETNKVMDKLDMISQLLDRQKVLITDMMGQESAQNETIQSSIQQIMSASSDIQNKIYETMDLMQFQDITRQKLERIIHHLRQIHDYIVDLLGTGFTSSDQPPQKVSLSRTIAQTGTTPDENKSHADSVVEQFLRGQKKG